MGHIPRCFTFAESDNVEHQLHVAFEAPWFPSRQAACAICVPSTAAPAAATAPRLSCLAESDRHLMAFMNRRAIEPRLRPNSDTMCLLHQDDMERLLAWHALENTRAISDRERLAAIIPMQVNRCPGAMLVFIAIPTVLIEQEIRIFTAIDARAASFVSEFLSLVLAGKNSDTNDAAHVRSRKSKDDFAVRCPEIYAQARWIENLCVDSNDWKLDGLRTLQPPHSHRCPVGRVHTENNRRIPVCYVRQA